jgi:hypothetical protein
MPPEKAILGILCFYTRYRIISLRINNLQTINKNSHVRDIMGTLGAGCKLVITEI